MASLREFQDRYDLSMEALCRRILDRHQATIRVRKPAVAVANLARIIETTLTLANRKGFHSTSLRDLAEQSGLSMGALYAYFDSKDTLLLMILGQVVGAVEEVLERPPAGSAPDPAADPVTRLRWLVETHVYLTETMHPWFVFAYMEAKAFPREGRDLAVASELATERLIADTLAAGVRAGRFRVDDATMTAALIKPLLQDWYVKRAKHRRRGLTPERYARAVTAFVETAVGLQPASPSLTPAP
ncbi:TetR/AcrR family transcriptional regulator [Azospirillum thermophilum]|uniref:TetR family transcriptional regulator n=1 Tax=Azospirillum thermophilum TaxID=2202148 RepID=A0A2S2CVB7_9PROT|nr:TetR/AcrR family transcriptional regulator [Azospirillum thermophilum]AWK88419.1 TetR family transcriptional regulator [Azospirillum thermophilum]